MKPSGEEILGLIKQKKSRDCIQPTVDHEADDCNKITGFSVDIMNVDQAQHPSLIYVNAFMCSGKKRKVENEKD